MLREKTSVDVSLRLAELRTKDIVEMCPYWEVEGFHSSFRLVSGTGPDLTCPCGLTLCVTSMSLFQQRVAPWPSANQ